MIRIRIQPNFWYRYRYGSGGSDPQHWLPVPVYFNTFLKKSCTYLPVTVHVQNSDNKIFVHVRRSSTYCTYTSGIAIIGTGTGTYLFAFREVTVNSSDHCWRIRIWHLKILFSWLFIVNEVGYRYRIQIKSSGSSKKSPDPIRVLTSEAPYFFLLLGLEAGINC